VEHKMMSKVKKMQGLTYNCAIHL